MSFVLKSFSNKEISNDGWNGESLPNSIKVANWGANETVDGTVYLNDKTLDYFNAYQEKTGRDENVPVDFDHASVSGSKEYVAGQPKPYAAYGNPRIVKGDGLYLDNLTWTDLGKKHAKNYMDLSPTAFLDEDGTILGLDSVALTATGAINGLTFYSAKTFDDLDNYMKNNTDTKTKSFDAEVEKLKKEYQKYPGNEGIKELSADDSVKDEGKHGVDCECAKCMDAEMESFTASDELPSHESKYGDVAYADTDRKAYPIDTAKHIRSAWSYINMPKNAEKYDAERLSTIKGKIKLAASKAGIEIADEKEKTKTMSADSVYTKAPEPQAFYGEPAYYKTRKNMSELANTFKTMAAEVGLEGETDEQKVLFAFLAKFLGVREMPSGLINRKDNTNEGGMKQFSADVAALQKEVLALKTQRESEAKSHAEFKRSELIRNALRDGKIVPFSADDQKTVDVSVLESVLNNLPSNMVPTKRTLASMNADGKSTITKEEKLAMFKKSVGISK